MPAGTRSGWMWGVEKIDIDASQRNQTDSCIGFACFSATSAICFKMRLYCPSLSSLRFNFCGELRGRKTICDLPSCKPASQPPAAAGSVLRAVKHFRDTECSWNAARQAEPWTSVSEQEHLTFKLTAGYLGTDSCSSVPACGSPGSWILEGMDALGHSSAAKECAGPCGSLLLLQLDAAPPLSVAFLVGSGTYLIGVWGEKRIHGAQSNRRHVAWSQKCRNWCWL